MKQIVDAVEKLVGRRPNTTKEIRAELINFLKINDAEDLIVDNEDISLLFELCLIYSDIPSEEVITSKLIKALHEPPLYKRVGNQLTPKQRVTDRKAIEKFANVVIGLHPDLTYAMKQHGVSFIDQYNVVFSFERLRSIQDLPHEFSGALVFPRIRTEEDRDRLLPFNYLEDKTWTFKTLRKKYSRLEGRYFTTTEMLDLINNREIITHGNY